jgi:uncharacterized phiE125 gp8 family phage protein
MRVVVIAPPAEIVSLDEVKEHLRLDEPDDDAFLRGALAAAVAHLDGPSGWLGRALGRQTLEARLDYFHDYRAANGIRLPYPPIASIVSVKHLDTAGVEQTVDPATYSVEGEVLGLAWGASWPSVRSHPGAVRIQYQAGYEAIPAPIRAAILLMVGDLYQNRGTVTVGTIAGATPMSTTVEALLAPFRVFV